MAALYRINWLCGTVVHVLALAIHLVQLQVEGEVVEQAQLTGSIEPAGDAPPQRPPFGGHLLVAWKLHTRRKQSPELLDTPRIKRIAKARTQAITRQVQPDPFVFGGAVPAAYTLPQGVKQLTQHGRRPLRPIPEQALQLRAQLRDLLWLDQLLVGAKNPVD